MIRQNCDRPIDFKCKTPWGRRGENYHNGPDNEASYLKEHDDITLHKTLAYAQIPENKKKMKRSR